MKRLLLTRTNHDIGNQYLYAYSEEIIADAKDHNWTVNTVENEKNNQKEIHSRIKKTKPTLIVFNGHGNTDHICGYKNDCLVDVDSAYLLTKTLVFARSCSALKELGKEAIKNGCIAFIGYNAEFRIPWVHEFVTIPLQDPTARPVLEVSNIVAKQLLKGSPVKVAVATAKKKASELILRMLASEEPYDSAAFRALVLNHLGLDSEGNIDAACFS